MSKYACKNETIRTALADKWTGAHCTINGKPATVLGRKLKFPSVVSLDGQTRAEYAWETVELIMTKRNGEFKS